MAYWLIKTEPGEYSFGDLVREKKVAWTGVKNALARQHLRAMQAGDEVLIYHTGGEKAVVGVGKVVKGAYPDKEGDAKAVAVDIGAGKALKRAVTLAEIKADTRLSGWGLVKMGRLSVVPTTEGEFLAVVAAGGELGR